MISIEFRVCVCAEVWSQTKVLFLKYFASKTFLNNLTKGLVVGNPNVLTNLTNCNEGKAALHGRLIQFRATVAATQHSLGTSFGTRLRYLT